jgi:pimeloyl-ACP methyl ester carboxylesterase
MSTVYHNKYTPTTSYVTIYYKISAPETDKPYLLFIHGIFANHTVFKKEAAYFKRKGYGIILIDLRGHGLSSKPKQKRAYDMKYLVQDIDTILAKENISKATIIAHSLGGIIGAYVYKHNKNSIDKLVLIDTPLKNPFHRFGKHMQEFLNTRVESFFRTLHSLITIKPEQKEVDFTKKNYAKHVGLSGTFSMPFFAAKGIWEDLFTFDSHKAFRSVKCPVLSFVGTKDYVANLTAANSIKKLLPQAKVVHLPADHYMVIEKSKEIENEIVSFLEKE